MSNAASDAIRVRGSLERLSLVECHVVGEHKSRIPGGSTTTSACNHLAILQAGQTDAGKGCRGHRAEVILQSTMLSAHDMAT